MEKCNHCGSENIDSIYWSEIECSDDDEVCYILKAGNVIHYDCSDCNEKWDNQ